jgi:ABC-type transport system substrate-binding protein
MADVREMPERGVDQGTVKDMLERLAERGTPIGPDELYRRASRAAHAPPPNSERPRTELAAACLATVVAIGALLGVGGPFREPEGVPRGGELSYAVESAVPQGWCLPETELPSSSALVASAIYETLTIPNEAGEYVPLLASTIIRIGRLTWVLTLRDGIRFHDGSELTAQVVKANLDAYLGLDDLRPKGRLWARRLQVDNAGRIERVTLADPDHRQSAIVIETTAPVDDLPELLYSGGRLGMMAPMQLTLCEVRSRSLRPVGTGPFMLQRWYPNQQIDVVANRDYWQDAPLPDRYPYLDEIHFRVLPEESDRVDAVVSGEVDMAQVTADAGGVNPRARGRLGVWGYDRLTVPELPNGDACSSESVTGHPVHGLWIDEGY